MNPTLEKIYQEGPVFTGNDGSEYHIRRIGVPPAMAKMLYNVVRSNNLKRTLEVGMGFGLSSLAICQALKDNGGGKHIAIDPIASTVFGATGMNYLKEAKLTDLIELYDEPSYSVLPHLLKNNQSFEFIFIDGCHLFDFILLDFFYAQLLVQKDGWICIDDMQIPSVATAYAFIERNLTNFSVVERTKRFVLMKKVKDDDRVWYHFQPFFNAIKTEDGDRYLAELEQGFLKGDYNPYNPE